MVKVKRIRQSVLVALGSFVVSLAAAQSSADRPQAQGKPPAVESSAPARVEKSALPTGPFEFITASAGEEIKGPPSSGRALVPYEPPVQWAPAVPLGQGYGGEVEPNGTFATATPMPSNDSVVRASLFPNGDVDFYSFTANAGDRVYAAAMTSTSAGSSTDGQLTLLASDGTTVIEFDDDNGSFAALSPSIAGAIIPSDGTYYLRYNDFTAGTTSQRFYELHLRVQSGTPTPEVEPNDTPATATPLPANGWVSGTRNPAAGSEQDWYSMTLNAGDTVFLSLDLNPERDGVVWNGRLGFGLFGDAGNQILVVDDAGTGDVAPVPNNPSEAMWMTVKDAGTYYAFVDSASAAVGGPTATYHLSVSIRPQVDEGVNCTTYTSTNVPQTIGPGAGLVSSTITVPGNPRVADLDVQITLNHALMQDLDVHLRSPAGQDLGLFTDIGAAAAGGQNQMDLWLDDEAGISLPAFTVLRGMRYKPESNPTAGTANTSGAYRLSWFDGIDAGGTWTLDIRDDLTNANGGTLSGWSLRICEAPPPPSCAPGFTTTTVYSTDFEANDGGFTTSGVQNEWQRGLPATAATTGANPVAAFNTCHSGVNCFKTDLTGTYNASSNQNLLSPNIDLTGLQPPVVVTWAHRHQVETANFDRYFVDLQEVGGANPVRLFEWLDPTPISASAGTGNPQVNIGGAIGWGLFSRRADSLAGQNAELRFNLTSDSSVQFAGVAVDDVSVTACRALSADLSITKTDGVASAVPGGSTTYTITASNAGPDPVPVATVADTFPAALTCNWTCVGAGGGTCSAAGAGNINDATVNLPAGGSVTYTAVCSIAPGATGVLANTATVSGGSISDPSPANNSATDTTTLTPQADLAITKTNGVTQVNAGGSTTYTIVASNAGLSNAPGSLVSDTFPAACTSVNWTCAGAGGGSCAAAGAGNLSDTVNLPAGGSVTYSAVCAISAAAVGTLTNTATVAPGAGVTDPVPGNNSATDSDAIIPLQADIGITKTDGVASAVPGTTTTYTIVASNAGPAPAPSVAVVDTFPAALTGVSWTCVGAGGGTCTAAGAGNINDSANLPVGASVTYTVNATIAAGATGTLSNTATANPAAPLTDPNLANNSATDTTNLTPQANLAITKTNGVAQVNAGTNTTYTIVASNAGPSNAPGSLVSDTFPAACTSVNWTCTGAGGGSCAAAGAGNIGDTVNLPVGGSVTYSAVCAISPAAVGTLTNTATVAPGAGVTDPVPGNNSATDSDAIVAVQADIGITKTDGVASAVPGTTTTYTIVVSNAGPAPAPSVAVVDTFPAALTGVSWTCVGAGGGTCSAAGAGNINDTANLPVGASVTYTVNATIAAGATGTLSNTATANPAAPLTDPNLANNSATDTTTLTPQADLQISLVASTTQVQSNVPLTLTATSFNAGPSVAQDVSVTLTLTPDLRYSSHAATGATCTVPQVGTTGSVVCTWAGATAPGSSRVLSVVASSVVIGSVSVNAGTASGTPDPVANNNASTLAITVGAAVQNIPTLGRNGLLLLGLMLGLLGLVALRRQV